MLPVYAVLIVLIIVGMCYVAVTSKYKKKKEKLRKSLIQLSIFGVAAMTLVVWYFWIR